MKHTIAETKINKSNRSLISTIPNTIVSIETLTNVDSIRWSYEIIDNKHQYYIEFIKNNEKTSSNIDVTTEKQEKTTKKEPNETIEDKTEIHGITIKKSIYEDIQAEKQKEFEDAEKEIYKQLVQEKKNRITNKDNTYIIAIQTNQRKTKTTYKLNFRVAETKQAITNITYNNGTLAETKGILNELETYTKDEVTKFILENSTTAEKNLKKYGLIN